MIFHTFHLRHTLMIQYWLRITKSTYGTKYSRMDQVKSFKGGLRQILLGPFFEYFVLYGMILQFSPKTQLIETWWIIEDQDFHLWNGFSNFTQIMHFELPTYNELPTMAITRDLYSNDANSTEEGVLFANFRGLRQRKLPENTRTENKDNFWRLSIPQTKYNYHGLR